MAAVYPVASGVPTHSGTYSPEVWSGKVLMKFYKTTVWGEISNTMYEGEIKNQGDTVHIREIPDMVINNHEIGQELIIDVPTPTKISLYINKGKSWSFSVDLIQEHQSDIPFVERWTDDGGKQLAIQVDIDVLGNIYADAHADNMGTTAGADSGNIDLGATGAPLLIDESNILNILVDAGVVMDEQSVDDEGQFYVLPPIICGVIKKSDLKDASLAGDATSIIRNGRTGKIDNRTVYKSRNLATASDGGTCYQMMFGHKYATTFASQIVRNEVSDNAKGFGKIHKGLHVYGYKVQKPEALGVIYGRKA